MAVSPKSVEGTFSASKSLVHTALGRYGIWNLCVNCLVGLSLVVCSSSSESRILRRVMTTGSSGPNFSFKGKEKARTKSGRVPNDVFEEIIHACGFIAAAQCRCALAETYRDAYQACWQARCDGSRETLTLTELLGSGGLHLGSTPRDKISSDDLMLSAGFLWEQRKSLGML